VATGIAEAYRKRNYQAYFVSKSSDSDMENSETRVWLDFAESCKYLDAKTKEKLDSQALEIGKLLNHMIEFPEKYVRKTKA
jgi:four helix bundle protein